MPKMKMMMMMMMIMMIWTDKIYVDSCKKLQYFWDMKEQTNSIINPLSKILHVMIHKTSIETLLLCLPSVLFIIVSACS